jgi:hypothetical protein
MAYNLELNADFSGALSGLQKLKDNLVEVKQQSSRSSQEMVNAFKTTAVNLSTINSRIKETANVLASAGSSSSNIVSGFKRAEQSVVAFDSSLIDALNKVKEAGNVAIQEASKFRGGSEQKQAALRKEVAELQRLIQLSKAANNKESVAEFTRVIELQTQKVRELTKELSSPKKFDVILPDGTVKNVSSLKGLLREAEAEAFALAQKFGYTSEQAIEARKRVAQFRDQINDARAGIDAFNPDKKFAAATQGLTALLGGFTALQGVLGFIGVEGDNAQRALVKIQSALAISQGLSQFLNFADALKNIRSVLGLTTAATAANTAAVTANTAAAGANATAQGVLRSAFLASATAVRTFTASLLANPLTALAVAIGAVVGALVLFGKEAEKTKEKVEAFLDSVEKVRNQKLTGAQFEKDIADLQRRIQEIIAGDDLKKRGELIKQAYADEIEFLKKQEAAFNESLKELNNAYLVLAQKRKNARGDEKKDVEEAIKANDKELEAVRQGLEKIAQERRKVNLRLKAEEAQLSKDLVAEEKRRSEERKKAIIETTEDLNKTRKELQKKAQQAQLEGLTGEARIVAERQIALQEVSEFEKTLKKKQLLQEEANKKLADRKLTQLLNIPEGLRTEEQIKEIDRLISEVKLKTEDVAALGFILKAIEKEFNESMQNLFREQAEARIKTIEDASERELAAFELNLQKEMEALKDKGISEEKILKFAENKRKEFKQKQLTESVNIEEQIALAEIEAMKVGKDEVLKTEEDKQLALLNIRIKFAQARLQLLEGDNSKEAELTRAQLKALIAGLEKDIDALQTKIKSKPLQWSDIFNVQGSEEAIQAFNQQMNVVAQNVVNITGQIIASAKQGIDAQIQANKRYISSLDERIKATEDAIERENELNKAGIANNLRERQTELELLKQQKQQALQEEKKLQAERARLERLQIIADAATQASSLAVATANLLKQYSNIPFVGIAIAAGAIASMISLFLSTKAKLQAATQPKTFGKGGRLPGGLIKGKSHSEGGVPVGNTGIYVEGKEYIVNKYSTEKHYKLIEAINKNDFSNISWQTITKLPKFNMPVMTVSRETLIQIQKDKQNAQAQVMVQAFKADLLRGDIQNLNTTLLNVAEKAFEKENVVYLNDGTKVITKGNKTTIIRKK